MAHPKGMVIGLSDQTGLGFSYSLGTVIQLWEDNKSPAQLCITLHYNLHIIVYILI